VRNTFATLVKYHYDLVASGKRPDRRLNTAYLIGNHNIYLQAISIAAVFLRGLYLYWEMGPISCEIDRGAKRCRDSQFCPIHREVHTAGYSFRYSYLFAVLFFTDPG